MSTYTSTTIHEGQFRMRTEFAQSGSSIYTDVGAALGGRGEMPSPAQLLAASVAACMNSMMVFMGKRHNINTEGIIIKAGYEEGRQGITALNFHITIPHPTQAAQRSMLEAAVKSCPVGNAISTGISKNISWTWTD